MLASGGLERLVASVARYAERALILSQIGGGNTDGLICRRIGPPLLFGRLWEETGCRAVIEALLAGRGSAFAVERAVFTAVLHRLFVSGSDWACETIPTMRSPARGSAPAPLLPCHGVAGRGEGSIADGALAPRCIKDVIEEQLFYGAADRPASCRWCSGHDDAHVRGRRWHDAGRPRPLQGPPAASTRRAQRPSRRVHRPLRRRLRVRTAGGVGTTRPPFAAARPPPGNRAASEPERRSRRR